MLLFLIYQGLGLIALSYLLAVLLHETGHALVAKKLGYRLDKFILLPYGACLSYRQVCFSPEDEIKIAIAGPAVNFFFLMLSAALWWFFPATYSFTYYFSLANAVTFLFNLLPAYPLDGGRIFISFLSKSDKRKLGYQITQWLNFAFSMLFFFFFLLSVFFGLNITYLVISIFLFSGSFDGKKQGRYAFALEGISSKKQEKILAVKTLYFPSSATLLTAIRKLSTNKWNILYIREAETLRTVHENELLTLLESYPMDSTFENIFKSK